MKSFPYLIGNDASGRKLEPVVSEEKPYPEKWLQDIIRLYPDLLPVAEIESVFAPLVCIGREVLTDAGPIDNLLISHQGYLVLVETKLWRNPEARREVIGQAIDYGSSLAKWDYEKLNTAVKQYTKQYSNAETNLFDWVEQHLGPIEGGEDFFEAAVARNLRLGRFLTLIVGDKIRSSVIEIINYVNKFPNLAMEVALVEMQCFWPEAKYQWPLLVVPRIVARTEIIERSVVEVTLTNGNDYKIEVRQEKGKIAEPDKSGRGGSLTEETFWEMLKAQVPDAYDTARSLITEYKERAGAGISLKRGEKSITVTVEAPSTGQPISLFYLTYKGFMNVWPGTIGIQLTKANLAPALVNPYADKMHTILKVKNNLVDFSCLISSIDLEQFKAAVEEFIQAIHAATPLAE